MKYILFIIVLLSAKCMAQAPDTLPIKDTTSYTCRLSLHPASDKEIKRLRKIGERANRKYRRYRRHGKG